MERVLTSVATSTMNSPSRHRPSDLLLSLPSQSTFSLDVGHLHYGMKGVGHHYDTQTISRQNFGLDFNYAASALSCVFDRLVFVGLEHKNALEFVMICAPPSVCFEKLRSKQSIN